MKRQRDGFATLYDALDGVVGLFVRADRRGWLAVLPVEEYLRLLRAISEAAR